MSKDDHTDDEQRNGETLSELLQRLQLPYLRAHYHELAQTAAEQGWGHLDYLQRLIEGEIARREDKSLAQRLRRARFPMPKTLDQFQWNWPKKINRPQIQNLFRLNFIEQKANVIFLGTVGLGKTHLSIALGQAACARGYSVLFTTAIDIIHTLAAAAGTGSLKRTMQRYLKPSLIVMDEIGYLPIDKLGADLLFQIISERYERGAILMSTNRAFKSWPEIFNNDTTLTSALLDRLLHHADVCQIEGPSFRAKDHIEIWPAIMNAAEAQIRAKVRLVVRSGLSFATLSTGERIAVALVLDRHDLVQDVWGTMLEAVHRLGPDWTQAALRIQRHGWGDEA